MTDDPIFHPGRGAVITGAASGIGLAAARYCAARGMKVLMADLSAAALDEAAAGIAGGTVLTQATDVSDMAAVESLKARAFAELGDVALLMNNAGASFQTGAFTGLDAWRRTFDVNLWGVVNGVQAFTQALIDQGRPARIVNTGSKQGITNPPGNPAYNATKAAVKSLTEGLQHSLRNTPDCQVSAHLLIPGFTYTGMTAARIPQKPPAAWTPEQVVEELARVLGNGGFYILCPDNETDADTDAKRILWGAGDVAFGRPALSRWEAGSKADFERFMREADVS